MDPPPLLQPPTAPPVSAAITTSSFPPTPTVPASNYSESLDSSPRSRNADSYFDDPPLLASKLRLMCSYGGHIVPRPHDKSLCYVGGDTRIVVVDRRTSLTSLSSRLANTLLNGRPFTLKYQLPSEDLDSLVSVTTDEDLENMIDEYDRTNSNSAKPLRLRLFLFPLKPDSSQSIGPILEGSSKSSDWFLDALNGASGMLNRGFSDPASVNCLLGLGDDNNSILNGNSNSDLVGNGGGGVGVRDGEVGNNKNVNGKQQSSGGVGQDVHSVPDSPMLETSSSFGSTSSSPSLANLPPIRTHVEDQKSLGIEEQFAQISVSAGGGGQKFDEGGFAALSSPPPMPVSIMPGMPVMVGEYQNNRVFSDDERSDHGAPVGYNRMLPPQQTQVPPQPQQKTGSGGNGGAVDLPSPDSISSDSSLSSAINRQKPIVYQDQVMQFPPGAIRVSAVASPIDPKLNVSDPNGRIQMQESAYLMQPQFDQHQHQQQQQQYIHAGAHYIQHHPTNSVPMSAYYPVYTQQQPSHQLHHQQLDQQYPVYYVQARQPQAYNMPLQQPNMTEASTNVPSSLPQTPPNPTMVPSSAAYNPMRNAPMTKPEMAAAGMYRTAGTTGAPQLVQVPSGQLQQQYIGYSQMHPSQSVAPPAGNAAYTYEYADPAHSQMFYTQPLAPTMTTQYQTMLPNGAVGLPETSGQLPTDTIKQQIRTS